MRVSAILKLSAALMVVSLAAASSHAAPAPNVDLARKCREMMIQAYPPAMAGSKAGTAKQQRDYFQSCIAHNGQMDEPSTTQGQGKMNDAPPSSAKGQGENR
jgi:hypothetical protein